MACIAGVQGDQEQAKEPQAMESQTLMSCLVGVRIYTQILWEKS